MEGGPIVYQGKRGEDLPVRLAMEHFFRVVVCEVYSRDLVVRRAIMVQRERSGVVSFVFSHGSSGACRVNRLNLLYLYRRQRCRSRARAWWGWSIPRISCRDSVYLCRFFNGSVCFPVLRAMLPIFFIFFENYFIVICRLGENFGCGLGRGSPRGRAGRHFSLLGEDIFFVGSPIFPVFKHFVDLVL